MSNFPFQIYAVLVLVLAMQGCAPNRQFRDVYQVCTGGNDDVCGRHSMQAYNLNSDKEYFLGFVEIDDQGQLRDRRQMQALVDKLYEMAGKDSLLINVFVHGWHHSAEPGDDNIENFKLSLAGLSKIERELKTNRVKRKVVGVYVGWRGESIEVPGINMLTFWDRKNTAHDIGYLGITELLLKLEEIANVRNSIEPPVKSRLITIGHSFGGAVVYSATSQILLSRFVNSQPQKGAVTSAEGFGDLVVLLNPAFEALRYAPAFDLAQSRCSYFADQVPKLAILTSETDNATGMAFPFGRTFSTIFETHGELQRKDCNFMTELDEGKADRSAVGHYLPLVSHQLTPAENKRPQQVARFENRGNFWTRQVNGGSTRFGETMLTHLGKTPAHSPYLNIRVDKALMDGHNDIFGDKVAQFLALLIHLSTDDVIESQQSKAVLKK